MELVFREAKKKNGDIVSVPVLEIQESDIESLESDNAGLCLACGELAYGVEPDAMRYCCESCDEPRVYGFENAMLMGRIIFK
jgi:hypothetical protein